MRKITKGAEPKELSDWKRKNPHGRYPDLTNIERGAINQSTRKEQFGLCAYCCKAIDENNSMNEHIEAQNIAKNRTLDFSNIVASCTTKGRCDDVHGSQPLPLTPLMDECETELKFYFSGKVEGLTDTANISLDVLALRGTEDKDSIKYERKYMIENLLVPDTPDGMNFLEDDLIAVLIDELVTPNENGQLQAYSPVLVNVLRQMMV